MRILIAEDDFASRKAILKFLSAYGVMSQLMAWRQLMLL